MDGSCGRGYPLVVLLPRDEPTSAAAATASGGL